MKLSFETALYILFLKDKLDTITEEEK